MSRGSNKGTKTTEYGRFKGNEQEYINTRVYEYEPKPKMRKDWIWWLLAVIVLSTSIYYVVDHMVESRDAVYDSEQIARLSAREAVEQMFDEDENGELSYIRRDLTVEEYNQIKEKVDGVPDSSEKVQINSLMRLAGEQLESQEEAIELVNSIKTASGEPNVDLRRADVLSDADRFPDGFNPEYVEELKTEYQRLARIVNDAHVLKETIQGLAVQLDEYLVKQQLDSLQQQVDALPFSDLKHQLTIDMKALYQEYDRQQEELENQRKIEEEIRRQEAEKRAEEEARKQAIIEQQLEEERQIQAERDRIEREERELIEQLEREQQEREQQEREAQQRAEEEARLEQERLEEEARLEQERQERERIEQEEQQRIEEEQSQQQGTGNGQ